MLATDFLKKVTKNFDDPWYRFSRIFSALENLSPIITTNSNWLDLGCNQGQFVNLLIDKYDVKVTGVDDWNENLSSDFHWRYCQRDLEAEFNIDDKFDFISALEVIEHITDTDKFISECWNHLNPGGYFVLSTPNINNLRNRVLVPLGKYPNSMEYRNVIHHVRLYNVPCLKSHLMEYGFNIKLVWGVSLLPQRYLKYSLFRMISENLAILFPQLCGNIILICQK
ncbi:MAG: class I SAM-dependent methyltransferase [Nostoc sp.]|uniref:class I SAM-dependent methyltransferase n=1 Tax=Nostoc sp. TaxID=1180 RepID=UPI002FF74FF3